MALNERNLKVSPWLWASTIVAMGFVVMSQALSDFEIVNVILICGAVAIAIAAAVMLILGIRYRRRGAAAEQQD